MGRILHYAFLQIQAKYRETVRSEILKFFNPLMPQFVLIPQYHTLRGFSSAKRQPEAAIQTATRSGNTNGDQKRQKGSGKRENQKEEAEGFFVRKSGEKIPVGQRSRSGIALLQALPMWASGLTCGWFMRNAECNTAPILSNGYKATVYQRLRHWLPAPGERRTGGTRMPCNGRSIRETSLFIVRFVISLCVQTPEGWPPSFASINKF